MLLKNSKLFNTCQYDNWQKCMFWVYLRPLSYVIGGRFLWLLDENYSHCVFLLCRNVFWWNLTQRGLFSAKERQETRKWLKLRFVQIRTSRDRCTSQESQLYHKTVTWSLSHWWAQEKKRRRKFWSRLRVSSCMRPKRASSNFCSKLDRLDDFLPALGHI